jgi:hypothetical protein
MAKLADAADLKSAGLNRPWGFKSPSGHQQIHTHNNGWRTGELRLISGWAARLLVVARLYINVKRDLGADRKLTAGRQDDAIGPMRPLGSLSNGGSGSSRPNNFGCLTPCLNKTGA